MESKKIKKINQSEITYAPPLGAGAGAGGAAAGVVVLPPYTAMAWSSDVVI